MSSVKFSDIFREKTEGKTSKNIFEVLLDPEYIKLMLFLDKLADVNQENVDSLAKELVEYEDNKTYLLNYLTHLMKIRSKHLCEIKKLGGVLSKECPISFKLCNEYTISDLLNPLLPGSGELYGPEKELKESILEDDPQKFLKQLEDPKYNSSYNLRADGLSTVHFLSDSYCPDDLFFPKEEDKVDIMKYIIFNGSIKCFKVALQNGTFSLDNTAKYAIASGNEEIIKMLVEKGVSFDNCLTAALKFRRNKLFQWLTDNYKNAKISLEDAAQYYNDRAFFYIYMNRLDAGPISLNRALVRAASKDNMYLCNFLINNAKCNPNTKLETNNALKTTSDTTTMLHMAIANDNKKMQELLVKKWKANVNISDNYHLTPLHVAAQMRSLFSIKNLIENAKVNMEAKDTQGKTPLFYAIDSGNMDCIKYLIEVGHAKVNTEDRKGETPAGCLYNKGYFSYLKELIEKGIVDPNYTTKYTTNLVTVVAESCELEHVKYLIDERHCLPLFSGSALWKAIHEKNYEAGEYYLSFPMNKHILLSGIGKRDLRDAIVKEDLELVKFYVEKCNQKLSSSVPKTVINAALKGTNKELAAFIKENL